MSITIGSSDATNTNVDTAQALIMAKKSISQQELVGQMALNLIESANIDSAVLPAVGNSGQNINIKV